MHLRIVSDDASMDRTHVMDVLPIFLGGVWKYDNLEKKESEMNIRHALVIGRAKIILTAFWFRQGQSKMHRVDGPRFVSVAPGRSRLGCQ